MLTRRAILLSGGALAVPATVWAHREKQTTTLVEWTGSGFDVTHTFHRHDAEVALSRAGLIDRPDIESLRSRAHVAIHVEETFAIEGVELETLGAETEGNRLFVYQQAAVEEMPEALVIRAEMLRGLWSDQINSVDVKIGREVKSLRFAGSDGTKRVELS